jgi:hypothetical protein
VSKIKKRFYNNAFGCSSLFEVSPKTKLKFEKKKKFELIFCYIEITADHKSLLTLKFNRVFLGPAASRI